MRRRAWLDVVERVGDRLPDPVVIFVWLILALAGASVVAAALGADAVNPVDGRRIAAESLLSAENVRRLLVEMPRTLTGFTPLGYVLVVILGAGVAERSGLFAAAMRGAVA